MTMRRFVAALLTFGISVTLAATGTAQAALCKPQQSAAMLTGPVYESIQAECNWIEALNRRDVKRAAPIIDTSFSQVDADGKLRQRAAVLANVARGGFGKIVLIGINVPFSAGSTNIVVNTWTFIGSAHRVTDVFFCNITKACRYRLIAEQITILAP